MLYFFIPGRIKKLSLAELKSVSNLILGGHYSINSQSDNYFLLRTESEPKLLREVFDRLGGFIKYGEVIDLDKEFLPKFLDKKNLTFGVSCYPYQKDYAYATDAIQSLSKQIKQYYQSKKVSARYVTPDGNELSSGQILQRKILEKGFELLIMQSKDGESLAGHTLAIQDLDSFASRDYERPRSDKKMGMLPPKLARMMVNLAEVKKGGTIWDPFCGSGTILLEALMLGYNVLGSDISEEAISDSETNILWLGKKEDIKDLKYSTFVQDITNMDRRTHRKLRLTEIDAIICEPYMGPPQKYLIKPGRAETLLNAVVELYKPLFQLLENINQHNLKVVVILPSYKTYNGWATVRYNNFISKRWRVLTAKETMTDLHWSRSNSIIRRNILIAQLKR